MFGFGIKSKVEKFLLKEFNYDLKAILDAELNSFSGQTNEISVKDLSKKFDHDLGKIQGETFNTVMKQAKNNYSNEYDAAIMFILVQMNTIFVGSAEAGDFIEKQAANIRIIVPPSSHSEDEINDLMFEMEKKHEIKNEEILEKQNDEIEENFNDWIANSNEETENNEQRGFKTVTFPNGDKYVGEWTYGIQLGQGTHS